MLALFVAEYLRVGTGALFYRHPAVETRNRNLPNTRYISGVQGVLLESVY